MRTYGTQAEAEMWLMLKGRQLDGLQWRRQFSIGSYILDFYCPSEKLAIELDGEDHYTEIGRRHDEKREKYLSEQGIKVIRFENKLVRELPEVLLEAIRDAIKDRTISFEEQI